MILCNDLYYPELRCYSEICNNIIATRQPVLIYGANAKQQRIAEEVALQGIPIEAFIDNNSSFYGTLIEGIGVFSPSKYANTTIPVIVATSKYYNEIISGLQNIGIKTILPYTTFMRSESKIYDHTEIRSNIKRFEKAFDTGLFIDSIDFVITEKCSLRCKDCSNLMQYFKDPKNSNYDELTNSFDSMYNAVDYIYEIRILGGEPLLNRDLKRYLTFFEKYDNIGGISILTNGTLPFNEDLLSSISNPRISVRISDYGLPKQTISAIASALESANVIWRQYKIEIWQDCAKIKKHNRNSKELKKVSESCCFKDTLVIKNGALWRCPFASNLAALHVLPKEIDECVYLCNSNVSSELREQIGNLLKLPFLKVCDYCAGRPYTDFISVSAGIQTSVPLELNL